MMDLKIKTTDNSYNTFKYVSLTLIFILSLFATAICFLLAVPFINLYGIVLFISVNLIIIITVLVISSVIITLRVYRRKKAGKAEASLLKFLIRLLMPLIMTVSTYLKKDADLIRGFFIQTSNILVRSSGMRYDPEELLIILPHCLQDPECGCRITTNIDNCKGCGKCNIGGLKELAKKSGIKIAVVTGGTAARNIVKNYRPHAIISVACERDLYSGIMDVFPIPVLGVLNERPNGPCSGTQVSLENIENNIKVFLKEAKKGGI